MSLLKRLEQAQQSGVAPTAGARQPDPPPAPPTPVPQSPARVAVREKLLRDIRRRLQDEAMSGLSSLLDVANPADLHKKVEGIVDRIIARTEARRDP